VLPIDITFDDSPVDGFVPKNDFKVGAFPAPLQSLI